MIQEICTQHEWCEVELTTTLDNTVLKSVVCRKCGISKPLIKEPVKLRDHDDDWDDVGCDWCGDQHCDGECYWDD